jgi:hypothetical protein
MRQPVVGVVGGSQVDDWISGLARRLGSLIAGKGWILLNGGRDCGVMAASAAGAREAGGFVVGILPDETTAGASEHLSLAICTGLGDGRNLVNVLSSDLIIALPGALGTLSEIVFALKHNKPVILLGPSLGSGFDEFHRAGRLIPVGTPEEAIATASSLLAPWGAGAAKP